jgi:hypothetical protein
MGLSAEIVRNIMIITTILSTLLPKGGGGGSPLPKLRFMVGETNTRTSRQK